MYTYVHTYIHVHTYSMHTQPYTHILYYMLPEPKCHGANCTYLGAQIKKTSGSDVKNKRKADESHCSCKRCCEGAPGLKGGRRKNAHGEVGSHREE